MSSTETNSGLPKSGDWIFLSDVHLGAHSAETDRDIEQDIINLIDYCEREQTGIVILGDFFDYWMEYPDAFPKLGNRVLERFRSYHRDNHCKTLFITGNHDNWTFGYLESLGFDIEHEYRIFKPDGMKILLLHGDGLSDPEMNFPRPFMHRLLRNSYFTTMYQTLLPPRAGWACMRFFSGNSRNNDRPGKKLREQDRIDQWMHNKLLDSPDLNAAVYGHHHQPFHWNREGKTAVCCGSFASERTLGYYTDRALKIVIWDAKQKKLKPFTSTEKPTT